MNENRSLEDQLEAVGAALRSRPPIADRVMVEVREGKQDPTGTKPPARIRRREITAAAASVAAIAATAVVILLALTPAPSIGWAQMAEALQAQPDARGDRDRVRPPSLR